ncbi:MAG: sigma-70 family RNA polymerase sigma factor [Clostridia bacterium]|nr:sigma-70 family RNA polymerase sigma factor [Clostridia bacterium]
MIIANEILMHYRSNKKHINNISLNDSIGIDKDGNDINLIDVLKSDNIDIIDELNKKQNVEFLYKYLEILTKREKDIVIKRYGLFNNKETTQKEIANKLGISRSYVSRIEKRAITKVLREFIKNKNL